MAEQQSSLGNTAKRKVYAQWKQGQVAWEEYRDAACHCKEKSYAAETQLELMLPEMWGAIKKRVFSNILMAIGSVKITSAHYRMRMVSLETGTRQRCLRHFLPPSSTWVMGQGSLSALSWRTMTERIINSQFTLELCEICSSSWIRTNLWSLMGFIQESSKNGRM